MSFSISRYGHAYQQQLAELAYMQFLDLGLLICQLLILIVQIPLHLSDLALPLLILLQLQPSIDTCLLTCRLQDV